MQAYQGYFKDGRFISLENVRIPENKRVIVTILDEAPPKINHEENAKAWREFFEEMKNIDEPLPDEFDEIISHRVNFTREVDL